MARSVRSFDYTTKKWCGKTSSSFKFVKVIVKLSNRSCLNFISLFSGQLKVFYIKLAFQFNKVFQIFINFCFLDIILVMFFGIFNFSGCKEFTSSGCFFCLCWCLLMNVLKCWPGLCFVKSFQGLLCHFRDLLYRNPERKTRLS